MKLPEYPSRALYALVALAWCAVQFYQVILSGYENEYILLASHVTAATAMILLSRDGRGKARPEGQGVPLFDVLIVVLVLAAGVYLSVQGIRLTTRMSGVSAVTFWDRVYGTILIVVLLEACRRSTGMVLTGIGMAFIAYAFVGPWLPISLSHSGISFFRFIDLQVLSTSGIFGSPISASAQMVFYFVIVGAFLERSGAAKLFTSIAYGLTSRSWGGAGKAAVVSSGLFGMISGSAVANVLISGTMSIPLMIRSGFKRHMAGAIEATASTGGQLAPPIMGAAAFILADLVGIPYVDVITAAIVPALLYYLSLFLLVHAYSRRENLKPDESYGYAQYSSELKAYWHMLIPIIFMIVMLANRYSLMMAGSTTLLVIVAFSWLRRETRLSPRAVFDALISGARIAADVAVPSAVAGMVVGTLIYTGLAIKMQQWMLGVADGAVMLSLIGAMLLTIVFGMGMPTAAAYLLGAILVGPTLQELGIPRLMAHLFIFYFAILSMVTPPVALSSYAAAGIAKANVWRLSVTGFVIAVPGFLIPFGFVYNPALALQGGDLLESIRVIGTVAVGIAVFSMAVGGHLLGRLDMPIRVLLSLSATLMIFPEITTTIAGFCAIVLLLAVQHLLRRRRPPLPLPASTQD